LTREQRRLAAVAAVDVVGYSRLMGRDESGTLACLREHRKQRFEPTLVRHGGRLVKLTGDGALVEFASAVDALGAAIEFQQAMAEANRDQSEDTAIVFRIGLHLGDLIVDGDDLYGDGVNVAARLEAEAPPGGIIISGNVNDAVVGRLRATFEDMGRLQLKNIERPVQAFGVGWDPADWRTPSAATPSPAPTADAPLALPDKPSIAVLPFTNMSGDPEQEYFADGMVEDITTALSRSKSLFVIARNSSFTYKGKAVDIKQVGRELGVRYVLEGSVRKSGNRVRITGQLIDAATGNHLWADRFDSQLEEIFDLQDRVTASVVGAISPKLEQAEIERSRRKPTESLQAYDYYFRALACIYRYTRESNVEALKFTQIANEFDPEFAASYALGAGTLMARKTFGWSVDAAQETREAQRLAGRALELGKDDPWVIAVAGQTLTYFVGQFEEGAALLSRAISLDPNLAIARTWNGWTHVYLGDVEAAIEQFQVALRLSPADPRIFMSQTGMAYAHFLAGRYEDGSSWATIAIRQQPNFLRAHLIMMACHAMAGRGKEAQQECELAMRIDPTMRISQIKDGTPLRPEDIDKLAAALRIASMPE
jgi:adenylate cyclase